jgi:hypothetical protein
MRGNFGKKQILNDHGCSEVGKPQREWHELSNGANKRGKIRVIRLFEVFASKQRPKNVQLSIVFAAAIPQRLITKQLER